MATPRSRLAPPFVLTAALLPLACRTTDDRPPRTAETSPVSSASSSTAPVPSTSESAPVASIASVAPPAATLPPPPPATFDKWTLLQENGMCSAMPAVNCGEMFPCPGPKPYDCPKSVLRYPAHVVRVGAECKATFSKFAQMECPPTASCNPPPPVYVTVKVDCPEQPQK